MAFFVSCHFKFASNENFLCSNFTAAELLPTNLATMKKRLKMKAKGEKKPKIKAKESPALGVEEDAMLPRLPSPSLDASSSFHASDGLPDKYVQSSSKSKLPLSFHCSL